jgi:diacylglycerol kinase family enzyme
VDVLILAPGPGVATRVPVLACRDALRRGAGVEIVGLESDADVDDAIKRADVDGARLVVAGGNGQLRAVLRRMVRRSLPRAGHRPDDLPADRTIPDLPALGVLPLGPVQDASGIPDLASRLGLPRGPSEVAAAVLGGRVRRTDLLRNDGGSVTVHGALLGGSDEQDRPVAWRARIDVDDAVLSDGTEPLLACVIANADGYATIGGLPLLTRADPTDGSLDVGVALPTRDGGIEVRRARGRAVAVLTGSGASSSDLDLSEDEDGVPFTDDGVDGVLTRKRTWWVERSAWGVYQL